MSALSAGLDVPSGKPRVGVLGNDSLLRSRVLRTLAISRIAVQVSAADLETLYGAETLEVLLLCQERDRWLEELRAVRLAVRHASLIAIRPDSLKSDADRATRLGVAGIVLESALDTNLPITISVVQLGMVCVPIAMRGSLEAERLSSREMQVLRMVVNGHTNAETAARLHVTESTVKSHLSSAYSKLGVKTRRDAAKIALDPESGVRRQFRILAQD